MFNFIETVSALLGNADVKIFEVGLVLVVYALYFAIPIALLVWFIKFVLMVYRMEKELKDVKHKNEVLQAGLMNLTKDVVRMQQSQKEDTQEVNV